MPSCPSVLSLVTCDLALQDQRHRLDLLLLQKSLSLIHHPPKTQRHPGRQSYYLQLTVYDLLRVQS